MRLLRLHQLDGSPVVVNIFNITHFVAVGDNTRIVFVHGAHIDVVEPFDTVDMASVKVGSQ